MHAKRMAFRVMHMTSIHQYRLDLPHFQAEPIDRVSILLLILALAEQIVPLHRNSIATL